MKKSEKNCKQDQETGKEANIMKEDAREWLRFTGKVLFWTTCGIFVIGWRALRFLNCLVAHQKYHWRFCCGEFYQFSCDKCGIDTEPKRTDTPGGM